MINWWTWSIFNHRPSVWSVSEESTPDCGLLFSFQFTPPHHLQKRRWQWKKENIYLLSHIGSMGLLYLYTCLKAMNIIHPCQYMTVIFEVCKPKCKGVKSPIFRIVIFQRFQSAKTGGVDFLSRVAPAYVCGRSSFCEGCGQLVTCRLAHGNHGSWVFIGPLQLAT